MEKASHTLQQVESPTALSFWESRLSCPPGNLEIGKEHRTRTLNTSPVRQLWIISHYQHVPYVVGLRALHQAFVPISYRMHRSSRIIEMIPSDDSLAGEPTAVSTVDNSNLQTVELVEQSKRIFKFCRQIPS